MHMATKTAPVYPFKESFSVVIFSFLLLLIEPSVPMALPAYLKCLPPFHASDCNRNILYFSFFTNYVKNPRRKKTTKP